jgi:ADP-ribose pyrophosphatase YjhB (NUDIX family)
MAKQIPTHVVFTAAWIHKDNKYLMSQRSLDDDQAAGMWTVPGGKIEAHEDVVDEIVEDNIRKEVKEEVGIEIGEEFEYIGSQMFTRSSGHTVVSLSFIVEWKSGEAKPLEDQEAVKWLSYDEIEKLVNSNKKLSFQKQYLPQLKRYFQL